MSSSGRRVVEPPAFVRRWLARLPPAFVTGGRAGFKAFFPLSVGLAPWGVVTGVAMAGIGLTPTQAMGMNLMVYAGVAQLGTLPLIAAHAPLWLIVATALALNLRFVIFSAALAEYFRPWPVTGRWVLGHLLVDGVFATNLEPLLRNPDKHWRLGHYLVPSLWAWLLWQVFALVGVLFAAVLPKDWSLEFLATIALMALLIPMVKSRPMLTAALVGGLVAVVLHNMPLKLGLFGGLVAGILAGFAAEDRGETVGE